jgi:hypothetical protein
LKCHGTSELERPPSDDSTCLEVRSDEPAGQIG